ncbi:AAA family ATPase [Mycolicibacterium fortuitum]|nr:AAA family ATPase [Mycolicibacterium fortuitum]
MMDPATEARALAAIDRYRANDTPPAEPPWPDDDPGPPEPPSIAPGTCPDDAQASPVLADMLLNRSALRSLPDPEPLINNVLDQGTTALLYGKHGTFKTFIALDWAASVATGRRWQNRATQQHKVLYIAGEGAYGFKKRIDAWEVAWQTQLEDDELDILPRPVNLTRPLDVANLAALIEWNGYGLVVLDTLARCMVGADENSAKDCGVVVDAMTRLVGHTPGGRGVVLGVHHSGKDGKTFRGSSVFEAGADTVYSSIRDGAVTVLGREKRKDGPEYDRHELNLDPIKGTDSCAISVHRGGGQTDRADKLLSIFVQHFGAIGASKAELRNVAEMPTATFHRALTDLLKAGDLVNHGTDQRPFYKQENQ